MVVATMTLEEAKGIEDKKTRKEYLSNVLFRSYEGEALYGMMRYANSYNSAFEDLMVEDLTVLADCMDTEDLLRAVIYGDVNSILSPVMFDGNGNLQSVGMEDVYEMAKCQVDDLADYIVDNLGYMGEIDESLFYGDEIELFRAWKNED